jgi:hypothetical protein
MVKFIFNEEGQHQALVLTRVCLKSRQELETTVENLLSVPGTGSSIFDCSEEKGVSGEEFWLICLDPMLRPLLAVVIKPIEWETVDGWCYCTGARVSFGPAYFAGPDLGGTYSLGTRLPVRVTEYDGRWTAVLKFCARGTQFEVERWLACLDSVIDNSWVINPTPKPIRRTGVTQYAPDRRLHRVICRAWEWLTDLPPYEYELERSYKRRVTCHDDQTLNHEDWESISLINAGAYGE